MTENTEVDEPKRNVFMDSDDEETIQRVSRPKKPIFDDSSDEEAPVHASSFSDRLNGEKEGTESVTSAHKEYPSSDENSPSHPRAKKSSLPSSPSRPGWSDGGQSDEESSIKSRCSSSRSKSAGSSSDSSQSSSDEESDGEVSIEAIKSKIINKHRASKSTSFLPETPEVAPEKAGNSKPKKEKAPSRRAKEAALAEIHSETQRMMRERKLSLPYHKPKQRTLEDFMNRRKCAPAVRLKTTSDELAKVWKHVEEREKNAELFYRSDSDDDPDQTDQVSEKSSVNEPNTTVNAEEPVVCKIPEMNCEVLNSQSLPVSQPTDSEEFPRLQLSDLLVCSDDTVCENSPPVNTADNLGTVPEVAVSLTVESIDTIVTDSIPHESEPLESSENMTQSTPDIINSSYSLSEKIDNLNLPISKCPKITGTPDEMIDLDDLSTKPGAFGLMQRFFKHAKLKPKKKNQENTLSIISSEVNENGEVVGVSGETIKLKKEVPKPGERLVVLKTALQQKIAINREQQLAKRMEEYKLYEDEFYGVDRTSDGELEEELLFEGECDGGGALMNGDDDVEDEEEQEIDNPLLEEEAAESGNDAGDGDEVDEEDERSGSDGEETDTIRLRENDSNSITSEDTDDESNSLQDVNDETPTLVPIPTGLHSLTGTQDAETFNESQLVALCSGDFSSSAINLQKLEKSSEAFQFQDVPEEQVKVADTTRKAFDSDSEEEEEETIVEKKASKKRKKLTFSDDEDDDVDKTIKVADVDGEESEEADDSECGDEMEQVDQEGEHETENNDEDDEEVQLAKKLSKGFLEHEAELSESEWGSEDEDEKGLDAYEEEEGDQEKISQRRLQKELGKIHAREVLAEDNREIRILQELLLEDGELHSDGPKRQRLFRWYNQDDDNPGDKTPLDFGENGCENDEEDEESWRRQRLERENFLRKKKIDNLDLEIVDSPVNFNDTRKGVKVTPKMPLAAPKSPDVKSHFSILAKRGSFLNRGEKVLSKLAEITNNAGTKEKSLGNSRNNRNMVFSVVSPPKESPAEEGPQEIASKRKGEPLASVMKKIKFGSSGNCSSDRVSALAQLKLFESTKQ